MAALLANTSSLSAALRPIRTTTLPNPSPSQRMVTFQGATAGSADERGNISATQIATSPSLSLNLLATQRHVIVWLTRTFGDTRVVRVIQELLASGRRVLFADDMESVAFIVMAQQQDGVLLPRVGFTDRVLRSAYCSAIQWYLEMRHNPVEFEQLVSRNNGLSMDSFRFNIPSGGKVVRSNDDDTTFGTPVVVGSCRPTLRRLFQGILLIIALIYSFAVPYFVARWIIDALPYGEYDRVVKVTAGYLRLCVGSLLHFAGSVFLH